jgi:alpha-galactosidase/6-phospho-beta-glucosidase family protein
MTDQVINNKSDPFGFLRRLGGTKAQEAEMLAEKEELMRELTENIQDAYIEWQNAMANFETAEGKEMVDYYSYKIKASQIRYEYLIRKAKEARAQ